MLPEIYCWFCSNGRRLESSCCEKTLGKLLLRNQWWLSHLLFFDVSGIASALRLPFDGENWAVLAASLSQPVADLASFPVRVQVPVHQGSSSGHSKSK